MAWTIAPFLVVVGLFYLTAGAMAASVANDYDTLNQIIAANGLDRLTIGPSQTVRGTGDIGVVGLDGLFKEHSMLKPSAGPARSAAAPRGGSTWC